MCAVQSPTIRSFDLDIFLYTTAVPTLAALAGDEAIDFSIHSTIHITIFRYIEISVLPGTCLRKGCDLRDTKYQPPGPLLPSVCAIQLFAPQELTPDIVTSAGYLEIPLMTAERAWAYAMQCKQETADAPYRVKRHVVTRLDKASKVTRCQHRKYCTTDGVRIAAEGGEG